MVFYLSILSAPSTPLSSVDAPFSLFGNGVKVHTAIKNKKARDNILIHLLVKNIFNITI